MNTSDADQEQRFAKVAEFITSCRKKLLGRLQAA